MNFQTRIALLAVLGMASLPTMADPPPYAGYGYGYGPRMMWQQMTPEQWQQHWEYMHGLGYGPGMMMGPGMMGPMTPQQYQQWWDQTPRQGYGPGPGPGPGMGMGMGMGPGMMRGPGMMWGPDMPRLMTPDEYKTWWEQMQQRFNPPGAPAPSTAPAK
jgi:hypothetical protein